MKVVGVNEIKYKSALVLGNTRIMSDKKFNWFQKLMWNLCFGIKVEEVM